MSEEECTKYKKYEVRIRTSPNVSDTGCICGKSGKNILLYLKEQFKDMDIEIMVAFSKGQKEENNFCFYCFLTSAQKDYLVGRSDFVSLIEVG